MKINLDDVALKVIRECDSLAKSKDISLVFLNDNDDMFEILFKYYETLKNYQTNLEDMGNKIYTYQEDKEFADKLLMKPKQAQQFSEELDIVKLKT